MNSGKKTSLELAEDALAAKTQEVEKLTRPTCDDCGRPTDNYDRATLIHICDECAAGNRMTTAEVIADLEAQGVDVQAFLRRIYATIERAKADTKRRRLTMTCTVCGAEKHVNDFDDPDVCCECAGAAVHWQRCKWADAEQHRSRVLAGSIGLEGAWSEWIDGKPEKTAMNREYEYRTANVRLDRQEEA